jgi:alpha-ribazole phosphatase
MEIYFIRHTTPLVDKGICYGQTNLELVDTFPVEKKAVINALPSSLDAIYSSPLTRCHLLATDLTDKPVVKDDRLMEINFGDWEMEPWNNIPKTDLDRWMNDFVNESPPNGESMLDLQHRVFAWWGEIKALSHNKIAVVTHAGVIRILHAKFNNIPPDQSFNEFQIDYGGVMVYDSLIQ